MPISIELRRLGLLCACAALYGLLAPSSLGAQVAATAPPLAAPSDSELTADVANARVRQWEENQDLDPALKARIIAAYKQAAEQLVAAADAIARSEQYARQAAEAPETLPRLKAELAAPVVEPPPQLPADPTAGQLQQLLTQAEAELNNSQIKLRSLQNEPKRRADRRLEAPKTAEAAQAKLQEVGRQIDLTAASKDPPELLAATRYLLAARRKAIEASLAANDQELRMFEATGELVSVQRDLAAQAVAQSESRVKLLRSMVSDRRRNESDQQEREARRTVAQVHPYVRKVADENTELAQRRKLLGDKIEQVSREYEKLQKQVAALDEQFQNVKTRIDKVGPTAAIGLLLRSQRDQLPDIATLRREISRRANEISNTYMQLIDTEERRSALATIDGQVAELMKAIGPLESESEYAFVQSEARDVFEARREIYDALLADSRSYFEKLVELDVLERQLIVSAREYIKFCDERILWIRSTSIFGPAQLRQLDIAATWYVGSDGWRQVVQAIEADLVGNPMPYGSAAIVFLCLLILQRPLRAATTQLGEKAARSTCISISLTAKTLLATILLSCLWPGVLGFVGIRLFASSTLSEFVVAIAYGLQSTALIFLTIEFLRQVCRRHGLGESHFAWSESRLVTLRRQLRWLMAGGLPLLFILLVAEAQASEPIKSGMGRLAFFVLMTLLALGLHRIARPHGGTFDRKRNPLPAAWWGRLERLWHALAVGTPLVLAGLAFLGYYYAALLLAWRLVATMWLVVGSLVVYSILVRWQLLAYRALAMRRNRERRAAEAEAQTQAQAQDNPPAPLAVDNVAAQAQFVVDLSDINKQTRKLLQYTLIAVLVLGTSMIWADILPALGALRQIELWTTAMASSGAQGTETVLRAVTLVDLLLAIGVGLLTLSAQRYLPSLMEMLILQRLPLDASVRYAIKTVSSYLVTIVGVIVAFGLIGVGWWKVQWLVAAISVGLGFGLQEIFANFVSGLILLVERPVRLGDIVTVGDVTGTITRIQMRATTITDWDMRELVVPNREFITGRVMNWTLSSTVSRMNITVEVAYGTDPDRVRHLLLLVASRNPLVLEEPPAHALLDEFTDSSLRFVLRVYMASRSVFLELRHALLREIAREFREAGIKFAYPQRDIHVHWPNLADEAGAARGKDEGLSTND